MSDNLTIDHALLIRNDQPLPVDLCSQKVPVIDPASGIHIGIFVDQDGQTVDIRSKMSC